MYPADFTFGKAEGALVALEYPLISGQNTNLTEATVIVKTSSDLNSCAVSEHGGEKLTQTKMIKGVLVTKLFYLCIPSILLCLMSLLGLMLLTVQRSLRNLRIWYQHFNLFAAIP